MIAAAIILAILVVAGGVIYLVDGRRHRNGAGASPSSGDGDGSGSVVGEENGDISSSVRGDSAADGNGNGAMGGDGSGEAVEGSSCCGMHIVCERDSLSTAASTEIVYYDDEELDIYADRPADEYTAEEAEQFRDILLTLLPEDIAGWARSLQLRHIALPAEVNDELLLIVSEARQSATR